MAKSAKKASGSSRSGGSKKSTAGAKSSGAARTTARAAKAAPRSAASKAVPKAASEARRVADQGSRVREQVRQMTSNVLRGEAPSPERVGGLFRDVMHGTMEAVDRALPPALRSDRFREAVDTFSRQMERIAHEAKAAGGEAIEPMVKAAKAAGERPMAAVQDSMRTGARVAAGAASRIMSATGGALSGFAEGLAEAAEKRETPAKGRRP